MNRTQLSSKWICFRSQVKYQEAFTDLGPIERAVPIPLYNKVGASPPFHLMTEGGLVTDTVLWILEDGKCPERHLKVLTAVLINFRTSGIWRHVDWLSVSLGGACGPCFYGSTRRILFNRLI